MARGELGGPDMAQNHLEAFSEFALLYGCQDHLRIHRQRFISDTAACKSDSVLGSNGTRHFYFGSPKRAIKYGAVAAVNDLQMAFSSTHICKHIRYENSTQISNNQRLTKPQFRFRVQTLCDRGHHLCCRPWTLSRMPRRAVNRADLA